MPDTEPPQPDCLD